MAASSRSASAALVERLQALADEPYRFDFFAALRFFDAVYDDHSRVGEGRRPRDEPVRLGQEPSLAFAPSTLAAFRPGGAAPHYLSQYFFGLHGPNGPMPQHITEHLYEREHQKGDVATRAFNDLFQGRMLALFYRAWANAQPVISRDRSDTASFDNYIGALFGLHGPELQRRDSVSDDVKRFWCGRLAAPTRPVEGLEALLEHFFGLPMQVREFVGEWLQLRELDWLRLGGARRGAMLGQDAVLGREVWECQHRFQLRCGPLDFDTFADLLPGRPGLTRMRDLVRNYLGDEFAWNCNLVLRVAEVPRLELGKQGQLGWTTWLGDRSSSDTDADDVVVDAFLVAEPATQTKSNREMGVSHG